MRVLVAFATRHGATAGIAERIAETMRSTGLDATATPVDAVRDVEGFDAFVIGSAAYMFHWLKPADRFVRRHRDLLRTRPLWLFSSGPLGTDAVDAKGRDQKVAAVPKGMAELAESLHAREHRVFFGAYAWERRPVGLAERFLSFMPAAREGLPEGDFRDWAEIEAWARDIAGTLGAPVVSSGATGTQAASAPSDLRPMVHQPAQTTLNETRKRPTPISTAISVWALLVFGMLWVGLVVALVAAPSVPNDVWSWLQGLDPVAAVLVWVLFLPLIVGVWAWAAELGPIAALAVVGGLALWTVAGVAGFRRARTA